MSTPKLPRGPHEEPVALSLGIRPRALAFRRAGRFGGGGAAGGPRCKLLRLSGSSGGAGLAAAASARYGRDLVAGGARRRAAATDVKTVVASRVAGRLAGNRSVIRLAAGGSASSTGR